MSIKFSFGMPADEQSVLPKRREGSVFHIAILGDFRGANREGTLSSKRVYTVDWDNLADTLRHFGASLQLSGLATSVLRFDQLDHFHPDQLAQNVEPLKDWLACRRRLLEPSTSAAALSEATQLLARQPLPTETPSQESDQDLLKRLLGGKPVGAPKRTAKGDVARLIEEAVAPNVVPAATPQLTAALGAIELEMAKQLRLILHHPSLQALERVWRGMDRLVRQAGGAENLRLHVLDLSKAELSEDLANPDELWRSGLHQLLRDQSWDLLLGLYNFECELADIELLGRLARIVGAADTAFIGGASPRWVGLESFTRHADAAEWKPLLTPEAAEAWQSLRRLPEARQVGLALPRFLLRLPYGADSDPIDGFPFEEIPDPRQHEAFLWGDPALACGELIAQGWAEGNEIRPSGQLEDLPVYTYRKEGETVALPVAEAWLPDRVATKIMANGFTPLQSIKGRDALSIPSLQAVCDPPRPLRLGPEC